MRLLEKGDHLLGRLGSLTEQEPAGGPPEGIERLEDVFLRLAAHARQVPEPARLGGCLKLRNALDTHFFIEEAHFLRTYALQMKHIQQGGGNLAELLLMVLAAAFIDQLLNLAAEVGSDGGNSGELTFRIPGDVLHALREAFQRPCRPLVGSRLEGPLGIILQDLHEAGDFRKDGGNFVVFHASSPQSGRGWGPSAGSIALDFAPKS